MGDTGSLFLGGAVCGMLFAFDMPLIMILVGIIYIAETLSDVIQVVYFKFTHGKRFFRMAPLHHHFEMGGWERGEARRCFCRDYHPDVRACFYGHYGPLRAVNGEE